MEEFVRSWLVDPTVGKPVVAAIGIIGIVLVVRLWQKSETRDIRETETRYRARKILGFLGYLLGFLYLGAVFSEKLGQFTVAFGVAGAGIAFALAHTCRFLSSVPQA